MPENDLSPWAHNKSREWLETVLKRSGFMTGIEDFMAQRAENISIGQCRTVLMFLIILGRPGIWPEGYEDILAGVESKVSEVARIAAENRPKMLSLSDHKFREAVLKEIQQELEILRRRVGKSRLKNKLEKPETWTDFWC